MMITASTILTIIFKTNIDNQNNYSLFSHRQRFIFYNLFMSVRLPADLVRQIREIKNGATPILYEYLCSLVIFLDELNLIDDEISFCLSLDDGEINIDWPSYELYADLEENGFRFHLQHTKFRATVVNFEAFKTLLANQLETVVDRGDQHDEYRKDKRTPENTIECTVPF